MRYGICGGPESAEAARDAGYDYLEMSVAHALKPDEDETAFAAALDQRRNMALPCRACNGFIPARLKIVGPQADPAALSAFADIACRRAERAGIDTIVLGSGGARQIPAGFDPLEAKRQFVSFCRKLGPVARKHGVTIAVEPLHDCNLLQMVAESAAAVREADHPAIRLLVDSFHWAKMRDSAEDIVANAPLLAHVHVATAEHRRAPGVEDCPELATFFKALNRAGYDGRVSIEVGPMTPEHMRTAIRVMRELEG